MSSEVHSDETDRLFRLYLRDHDGASAGGVRLVQRSHRSNVGTDFEAGLAELETNIREDQAELSAILKEMHISPSRTKEALTWLAATVGGLKLNGHVVTYSPLSRVVEIEALSAAVAAKLRLWMTLADMSRATARFDDEVIARLQERAHAQLDALATMHRSATALAFGIESGAARWSPSKRQGSN